MEHTELAEGAAPETSPADSAGQSAIRARIVALLKNEPDSEFGKPQIADRLGVSAFSCSIPLHDLAASGLIATRLGGKNLRMYRHSVLGPAHQLRDSEHQKAMALADRIGALRRGRSTLSKAKKQNAKKKQPPAKAGSSPTAGGSARGKAANARKALKAKVARTNPQKTERQLRYVPAQRPEPQAGAAAALRAPETASAAQGPGAGLEVTPTGLSVLMNGMRLTAGRTPQGKMWFQVEEV